MKKIKAIIRPEKMMDVKEALAQCGITDMTISEVAGCGLQKGWANISDWQEFNLRLLPKVKIEIIVRDSQVREIIGQLSSKARTGEAGDGKIFIHDIQDALCIRTGHLGEKALDQEVDE